MILPQQVDRADRRSSTVTSGRADNAGTCGKGGHPPVGQAMGLPGVAGDLARMVYEKVKPLQLSLPALADECPEWEWHEGELKPVSRGQGGQGHCRGEPCSPSSQTSAARLSSRAVS